MVNREQLALLRQGTTAWNAWREQHPNEKIDLRYAELRGLNLSQVDLHRADLSSSTLSKIDLHQANLAAATLSNADLNSANLSQANLSGATCFYANLSNATLTAINLTQADLRYADLRDANLQDANLYQAKLRYGDLRNTILSGADFSEGTFNNTNLKQANLQNANLSAANFSNADLSEADLSGVDLSNSNFSGADLSHANLRAARASGTNFDSAILSGACIQAWQVDSVTNLNNVRCDYVFRRFNAETRNYEQRYPTDLAHTLAPGDLVQELQSQESPLATIDLAFTDGIDWQAFYQAFQALQSCRLAETILLQAFEHKQGALIVRLSVDATANNAEIAARVKQLYGAQLATLEAEYEEILRQQGFHRQEVRRTIEVNKRDKATLMGMLATLAASQHRKYDRSRS